MDTKQNSANLVLRNGRVIDPAMGLDAVVDVLIENGIIAEMSAKIELGPEKLSQFEQIDASGKWIVPGLIDMHVHLREPGEEYKETICLGNAGCRCGRIHLGGVHAQHATGKRLRSSNPVYSGEGQG